MARRDCLFSVCFLSAMCMALLVMVWWWATHFAGPFIADDIAGIRILLRARVANEDIVHLLKGEQPEKAEMDALLKLNEQTALHIVSRGARHLTRPQRVQLWKLAESETVNADYERAIKCNIVRFGTLSEDEIRTFLSIKQDKGILAALLENETLTPQEKAIVVQSLSPELRTELCPTSIVKSIEE